MKGYLVLSTGETFVGKWCGSSEPAYGEVVFFTGMTGYQEVLTDPSYKEQIVVFTYPLIGNYGICVNDEEINPQVAGLVMAECSEQGFHYESQLSFQKYCQENNIPMLVNVDTRAIMKRLREIGDTSAIITNDLEMVDFKKYVPIGEKNLIAEVTTKEIATYGEGDFHVVLVDFGHKKSIIRTLLAMDCKVTVVPYDTSFTEIANLQPNGIVLSNGPGNPKQIRSELNKIKQLAMTYPTIGICLGHQLLALAFGADTEKLHFGHRGTNQPVQDLQTNRVYMTCQNHSYVVKEDSLRNTGFSVRYKNINDGSVEGLRHELYPITTIQFQPEAHPGPSDSEEIFAMFINEMRLSGREKEYAKA